RGSASRPLRLASSAGHCCCFLQTDRRTHGAGLTSDPTHEDRVIWIGHHRLPPLAACEQPPGGGVHKSRSRLARWQAVESYLLRIRSLESNLGEEEFGTHFYDPVVLEGKIDTKIDALRAETKQGFAELRLEIHTAI